MTPDHVRASYRRMIDAAGEGIKIRRYTGTGAGRPYFEAAVRARVTGFDPRELVGGIGQADRKVIVLAEDLIAAQFALPLRSTDKAVVRGKELAIEVRDNNTRRVRGELIAYELRVTG